MEVELVALDSTCTEAECLRNLLSEIPIMPFPMPHIAIHCDPKSAIELCKCERTNDKTNRHMRIHYRLVWRHLKHNVVSTDYINSELNLADCLSKGCPNK